MNPLDIIRKYYTEGSTLYDILVTHSRLVTEKAIAIALNHPELHPDVDFIREAAMLHDIGIFLTDAPDIACYGNMPYICHGYLGHDILQREGFPRHALLCERHTGMGMSRENIINNRLPLPHRDMLPVDIEEQIVCFADKFFSKTRPDEEKSLDSVRAGISRFGQAEAARFDDCCKRFLG
ncbi:MAG: HDIG domain-containing protein [Dysgonamonadaceae bacterium]|jgi:uncharacterized protein|nr:HDIG domain-containing protein [Dysgonamonadaceae bacterium]